MSRRSHHDTRDAGRQPRTGMTLEQLSRCLETLEAHLVGSRDDAVRPSAKQHPAGPDRSATERRFATSFAAG